MYNVTSNVPRSIPNGSPEISVLEESFGEGPNFDAVFDSQGHPRARMNQEEKSRRAEERGRSLTRKKGAAKRWLSPPPKNLGNSLSAKMCSHCNPELSHRLTERRHFKRESKRDYIQAEEDARILFCSDR